MKDENLPQPTGDEISEPIYFPRKNEVCRRLDDFYKSTRVQKKALPSSMFLGALYVMQKESKENNPDWMSQAAHSLREIFYKLGLDYTSAFKDYGSIYDEDIGIQKFGQYKNLIVNIAHHNLEEASKSPLVGGSKGAPLKITPEIFERIILQFGDIIFAALRRQVDAHREIDEILKTGSQDSVFDRIEELINLNPDARQYFYTNADERWFDWLWKNGFLDKIKKKAKDLKQYSYNMPELNYLVRVAEKDPGKVVKFMNSFLISKNNFNPEVIAQFLRICDELSVNQLARVIPKINKENWVKLMDGFNQWGFEYEKMFEKLYKAKDYENILLLAETVLSARSREELEKDKFKGLASENPFYFNDLSYTKVFKYLSFVDDKQAEKALKLTTDAISQIICLESKSEKNNIFSINDTFPLFDVDFFTLELGKGEHLSHRDDIRELMAVIKNLADRTLGKKNITRQEAKNLYKKYFEDLPDSRSMWRFKLYVLSLHPGYFKKELKTIFLKPLNNYKTTLGPEYERVLKCGFRFLSQKGKNEYIKKALTHFINYAQGKNEKDWYIDFGSRIFSILNKYLAKDQKEKLKQDGFKINSKFDPHPSIGRMESGTVVSQPPISQDKFNSLSIEEIVERIKTDWSPEELYKKYKFDDIFSPHNAEGVSKLFKNDIPNRLQDYLNKAGLFFDRYNLDQHYTYSFLRGIYDEIRNNRENVVNLNWQGLINLFLNIKESNKELAFESRKRENNRFDSWLADWDAVHSAIADIIQALLNEKNGKIVIDFQKYRKRIFEIIDYLLKHPDPKSKDEKIKSGKITTRSPGDKKDFLTDPFTLAINSVRGRAFQDFVLFVYQDGKKGAKISKEAKDLYEEALKNEKTRAIMFMFGRYLPSFYYRDKNWFYNQLPKIFPKEQNKRELYIAAWEGYLANNLYEEIFFDSKFQDLYKRSFKLKKEDDPNRKYFRDLEEGFAIHFALAFLHYKKFGFENNLFDKFWQQGSINHFKYFINFIGRAVINGEDSRINELSKKNQNFIKRLEDFWNKTLDQKNKPEIFEEFGFWINSNKKLFKPEWLAEKVEATLVKTKGAISWDYGLIKSMEELAKVAPEEAVDIARLYLLKNGVRQDKQRILLHLDKEWFEAFKILYNNPNTKDGTYKLINNLIREGGKPFWIFEEIVKE